MKAGNDCSRMYYQGVLAALTVVKSFGEDTIFSEIVRANGARQLVKEARRAGLMRHSGMSEWWKDNKQQYEGR